jgi:hypothetical protein
MLAETGTGNDTLYLGARGRIEFSAEPQGAHLAAVTFPLVFHFSNGNVIGPVSEWEEFFVTCPPIFFPPEDSLVYYGNATDPDTLLFAVLDFGGNQACWTPIAWVEFAPLDTGLITIDSVTLRGTHLSAVDWNAELLPIVWQPKTVAVVPCPVNVGDMQANGNIDAADVIYLVAYVFRSGPAPLPRVEAGDVDCSGTITSADVIYLVNHVFRGGAAPCGCSVGAGM